MNESSPSLELNLGRRIELWMKHPYQMPNGARCTACGGSGGIEHHSCTACGGSGRVARCRAKCSDCYGRGCAKCAATGRVCPVCLGMRFLHKDVPPSHPDFGKPMRCEACCEGNQVNPERELRAVKTYLRSYVPAFMESQAHS